MDVREETDQLINNHVSLVSSFLSIWKSKIKIFLITFSLVLLSAVYSFSLPNIYTSKTLLMYANKGQEQTNSFSGLGGIAGLAGINLNQGYGNTWIQSIETLESLYFFENEFLPKIFLPDLMAYDYWDDENEKDFYLSNEYDLEKNKWVRDVSFPKKSKPSAQESYEKFYDDHISIKINDDDGLVELTISHESPHIAQFWLETIIDSINEVIRNQHKEMSIASLEYLNSQLIKSNLYEVKVALSNLIEQESEKLMLVEANSDYVFLKIDPPSLPEFISSPKRLLIVFSTFVISLVLSIIFVIFRDTVKGD